MKHEANGRLFCVHCGADLIGIAGTPGGLICLGDREKRLTRLAEAR